jgi:hypothetical protein
MARLRSRAVILASFVLASFPFAKLRWFFRHDRDARQNRKKPAIRYDTQPTSNIGDNEIFRFDSVGVGFLGATPHRRKALGVFRRPPEAGVSLGGLPPRI